MAFIATAHANGEAKRSARACGFCPGRRQRGFAILIRSDIKGKGLGAVLMKKLVDYCRE